MQLTILEENRFEVGMKSLDWVPNFEGTRWFLVLRVGVKDDVVVIEDGGLRGLLRVCNRVIEEGGRKGLYTLPPTNPLLLKPKGRKENEKGKWKIESDTEDGFHISLAWTLREPDKEMRDLTEQIVRKKIWEDVGKLGVGVKEVKVKLGNVVHGITLEGKRAEGIRGGLFEL